MKSLSYYTRRLGGYIRATLYRPLFGSMERKVVLGRGLELVGIKRIHLRKGTTVGDRCSLSTWGNGTLTIGEEVGIGHMCHITAANNVTIGNHVLLGQMITIADNSHGDNSMLDVPPLRRTICSKGPIVIEDNVWIGDKATILAGVTIGEGAVIGANAVVTKNVPSKAVVVGNPAHIIRRSNC